jgi:hypothetical protein
MGLALLLVIPPAACTPAGSSTAPSASPSSQGGLPGDPDALVLQVRNAGGLMAPDYAFRDLPRISVYADGRVIVEAVTAGVHPGSLLPGLVLGRIGAAQLEQLLAEAEAAGLSSGTDASYPPHDVFDAPATVFVTRGPRGVTRTSFGALGIGTTAKDPAEAAAREKAMAFLPHLAGLAPAAGSDPYRPAAVRLAIRPYAVTDPAYLRDPVEWPLASSLATAGTPIVQGSPEAGRCLVVSGADLDRLWPVLAEAGATTPFVSDGGRFGLIARPLLPDEAAACP